MHILDAIDAHAKAHPDAIALQCGTAEKSSWNLTYGELAEKSDRLAAYLSDRLGNDRRPLIVYGHKNPYMLVCFLACAKSGRAYCPIDISVPQERILDIVEETKAPIFFATEPLEMDLPNVIELVNIEQIISNTTALISSSLRVKGEDVFYIIFTSGSTGKPKGVQITLNCLNHFIQWAVTLGETSLEGKNLIFLNQAPFSFDLSVMDLYMSLSLGGTLWTLEKEVQSDMRRLFVSFAQSQADVWVSTPSFADMCLSDKSFEAGMLPNLSLFLFCGETLTNRTAKRLHQRFPDAAVVNTYGPTESTVAVTQVLVTEELCRAENPLPVGRPKPGTWIFIVGEDGRILPDGERGEIIIVGDSVSVGYYHRPKLTEKAFFLWKVDGQPYRAYRTGDEGYLRDGQLYYCGRIDLQIKLHGYRMELGDIENNLLKLEDIKKAVVLPVVKEGAVKSLTAFLVPSSPVTNNFQAAQKIRKELARYLPAYMIPKKFIFLDTIPMTSNGKADRNALKEMLS